MQSITDSPFNCPTNGVDDCTQAFQDFANSATVLEIYVPPGTYQMKKLVSLVPQPVVFNNGYDKKIVCAPGAVFIKHYDTHVFLIDHGYEWIENVSGYSSADVNLAETGTATNTVPQLTLANARTVSRGDVVKIVSDDITPNAKPGEDGLQRRRGEHFVAPLLSTGTTVTAPAPFRETYVTNIRAAKMKNASWSIEGGTFDFHDDLLAVEAINSNYIYAIATRNLRISGIRTRRCLREAIRLHSCYQPRIDNCEFNNHSNLPTKGWYGYGVSDFVSEGLMMTACSGSHLRHLISSSTNVTSANHADVHYYGRSANSVVSNCVAYGCSNTPFDTHEETWNWTFANCRAVSSFDGATSSGGGFSARGYRIRFIDCVAENCRAGFVLTTIDHADVIGCAAYGTRGPALVVQRGGDLDNTAVKTLTNVRIRDSYFESTVGCTTAVIDFDDGNQATLIEAVMENVTVRLLGAATADKVIECQVVNLRGDQITVDLRGYTGSGVYPLYVSGSGNDIDLRGLKVKAGAATIIAGVGASSSNSSKVVVDFQEYQADVDITSSSAANRFRVSSSLTGGYRVSGRKAIGTSSIARSSTAYVVQSVIASTAPSFGNVGDAVITYKMIGSAGDIQINSFPTVNRLHGDVVTVVNQTNGTVSCLTPAFDLPKDTAKQFVFDGSVYWAC